MNNIRISLKNLSSRINAVSCEVFIAINGDAITEFYSLGLASFYCVI